MRRFKSSSSKDQRVPTPDFTENTVSNGLECESGLNPMKFMGIFVVCLMGLSVLFSLSAILQNPPSESLWTVAEARPLDVLPQKGTSFSFFFGLIIFYGLYFDISSLYFCFLRVD